MPLTLYANGRSKGQRHRGPDEEIQDRARRRTDEEPVHRPTIRFTGVNE